MTSASRRDCLKANKCRDGIVVDLAIIFGAGREEWPCEFIGGGKWNIFVVFGEGSICQLCHRSINNHLIESAAEKGKTRKNGWPRLVKTTVRVGGALIRQSAEISG